MTIKESKSIDRWWSTLPESTLYV